MKNWLRTLLAFSWIYACEAEVCYYGYGYYYGLYQNSYYFSVYCSTGCCGYYYSRSCCSSLGQIVGLVIGCLIVLGIIGAVVAVCIQSKKNRRARGVIVAPARPVNSQRITVVGYSPQYPSYPSHHSHPPVPPYPMGPTVPQRPPSYSSAPPPVYTPTYDPPPKL